MNGQLSPRSLTTFSEDEDNESCSQVDTPSAVLPSLAAFHGVGDRNIYAVDCGGSLTKLVYTSSEHTKDGSAVGASLHFRKFPRIRPCLDFIAAHVKSYGDGRVEEPITCTGGGSYKNEKLIGEAAAARVARIDEMEALVNGCNFLLKHIQDESFTYHHDEELPANRYKFRSIDPATIFPYQLVCIGTGISVIKVDNESTFTRIGGSTMGGGAFTGLGSLLTNAKSFDELLLIAEKGDHRKVDVLVADLPFGSTEHFGLPPDLIAGSFGKCVDPRKRKELEQQKSNAAPHLTKSLLLMISNSVGQMATLYGEQHKVRRIYFGGYFIRKHPLTMRTISFAVNYWSKGKIEALFLKHEGYIGAVGAFLHHVAPTAKLPVN